MDTYTRDMNGVRTVHKSLSTYLVILIIGELSVIYCAYICTGVRVYKYVCLL